MRRTLSALTGSPDLTIATGLLALGLVEALGLADGAPVWPQALLTFGWTVPLLWRRRWPLVVLAVVIVMGPTLSLVNEQGGVMSFVLAAILASYTVGRELEPPATWWGPGLTVGLGWVVFGATDGALSDFVFVALLYGGAWAVGYAIRRRDQQLGELTRETEDLRRLHAERELRAVEEERARIARELHDIVSHSISVITIQAQAVRRQLGPSHSSEIDALRGIEMAARQAMAEMRRLLGVLRAPGDRMELAPQPGLDQVTELIAEARSAGIEVRLSVEGAPAPLPPGVGLTSYRVVQEALTNVRKHTDAASAAVVLRYHPDSLEILVDDSGKGRVAAPVGALSPGGHGLAGMRERVTLYGGRLTADSRPEGGFRVHVWLPLFPAEVAATQ